MELQGNEGGSLAIFQIPENESDHMALSPPFYRIATGKGKDEGNDDTGRFFDKNVGSVDELPMIIVVIKQTRVCFDGKWEAGVEGKVICRSNDGMMPDMKMFDTDNDRYDPEYPEPVSLFCAERDANGGKLITACKEAEWEGRCKEGKVLHCIDPESCTPFFLSLGSLSLNKAHPYLTDGLLSLAQFYTRCLTSSIPKSFSGGVRVKPRLFFFRTTASVATAKSKKGLSGYAARFKPPSLLTPEELADFRGAIMAAYQQQSE
jgi:hypothetical protein